MANKCPTCHSDNPEASRFCAGCGTQLPPPPDHPQVGTETLQTPVRELTTGSTFAGRYQIIEELGRGGMGRVYKVFDTKVKEKVALKLIKPEIASDQDTVERFNNEIRLARRIRHKNVCGMFDLGEAEGAHFITMEYVHGEDLKSMIEMSGSLSLGMLLSVGKQVCEGLAEAHSLGVMHRDLKPQNIMIDKHGNAKIMDFGIARSVKDRGMTGAGVMIGTPEYMSPEQAEAKEVDHRSDIYSLGVILYEVATSHVPFTGETALSIAMKHKGEIPKNPKLLNAQIPDDLSGVILKCLEKDKAKRYQSASDVRSELEKIEKGIPTTERVVPVRKTITSRQITVNFTLKKLFVPAIGVLAIAIVAFLIVRLLPKRRLAPPPPSGKPSLAVLYFKNNTGDEKLGHWRAAIADLLITDLSQSRYIRVLSSDQLFNILSEMNQADAKSFTSKVLKDAASRGGVKDVLVGSYAKAGDNFRIDVSLQEAATGEILSSERVEGRGEDSIFSMVDELTKKLKVDLKLSTQEIASDVDRDLEKITTSSPEAFKYYSEGRRLHDEQAYRPSIQMMEKAITIDPNFAMAYRSMSMSLSNLTYYSESQKYLQKAFELRGRLSDRERYAIEGDFYRGSEKSYGKAVEAYQELLKLYPDDSIGITNLGILYTGLEEWDKAIEHFERRIRANPEDIWPYLNLEAFLARGLYEKAKSLLESYIHAYKDNYMLRLWLAAIHFLQRQYDQALVQGDRAASLFPSSYYNPLVKGMIFQAMGRLPEAENEYRKLLGFEEKASHLTARNFLGVLYLEQGRFKESEEQARQGLELAEKYGDRGWVADFHLRLARLYLGTGRPRQALEESRQAGRAAVEIESLARERTILLHRGLAELELGLIDAALRTAGELKISVDSGPNRKAIRYYDLLMGMIALKKGNLAEAVEHVQTAVALLPLQHNWENDQALFLDALARAHLQKGDLDEARAGYEKILLLTFGRQYFGDVYVRSFYQLGRIYGEQRQKALARQNYQQFLELWKDADPGLPEVVDAKRRLTSFLN